MASGTRSQQQISRAGDVYSYGIIILEMLTGKRPTDVLFKNGLTLQKFVGNSFPEKIRDILDPNIIIPSSGDEGVDHGNHNGGDAELHYAACSAWSLMLHRDTKRSTDNARRLHRVSAIKRESRNRRHCFCSPVCYE